MLVAAINNYVYMLARLHVRGALGVCVGGGREGAGGHSLFLGISPPPTFRIDQAFMSILYLDHLDDLLPCPLPYPVFIGTPHDFLL